MPEPRELLATITGGTFTEFTPNDPTSPQDGPLGWPGYDDARARARAAGGESESVVCGRGRVGAGDAVLVAFDFRFLGGSVGGATGERVCRAIARARDAGLPLVSLLATGGSRMQEGMVSLHRLQRMSAELSRHAAAGLCAGVGAARPDHRRGFGPRSVRPRTCRSRWPARRSASPAAGSARSPTSTTRRSPHHPAGRTAAAAGAHPDRHAGRGERRGRRAGRAGPGDHRRVPRDRRRAHSDHHAGDREGGSGGALALCAPGRTWIAPNAYFSVIAPELAAAILKRDTAEVPAIANRLRPRPADLVALGLAEGIAVSGAP